MYILYILLIIKIHITKIARTDTVFLVDQKYTFNIFSSQNMKQNIVINNYVANISFLKDLKLSAIFNSKRRNESR